LTDRRADPHSACWKWLLVVPMILMALSPALCATVSAQSEEDLFSGVTTLVAPYSKNSPVSVDGVITGGEFDSNVTWTTPDTDISISLLHDNDSLYVGISGASWSWVAFGISSDSATTMGFVLIANIGTVFEVEEGLVTNVSDNMVFQPVTGQGAVREFEYSSSGGNTTAELQLALVTSVWSLEPGVVYPTVVATNRTAPTGIPTGVSGDQVHFMGSYLLRQGDSVKNVNELLNGNINPIPSLIAVGILSIGIVAIFIEFVVRRQKQ